MYSVCSFRYMLANSFCAFLSFRALVLVRFLLLHLEAVFTFARFVWTANVSHGVLGLALCLVGIHSPAASMWALMKFSYSSFGVCVYDFSCSASNLFLSVSTHLSLISVTSRNVQLLLFGSYFFVGSVVFLPWQFGDRRTHPRKRNIPRNSIHYYSISYS